MKYYFIVLQNSIIILRCFLFAMGRGRAVRMKTEPTSIAILQASKIGDMVCATPLYAAVKKKYPLCLTIAVADIKLKEIYDDNDDIDIFFGWHKNEKLPSIITRLKTLRVDAAIMTAPNFFALAAMYLAGIPMIVCPRIIGGYSPYETISYKILRLLVATETHEMGQYAPLQYLKLLRHLGIEDQNVKKHLGLSKSAEREISEFFQEKNMIFGARYVVGISVSAGNKIKEWPLQRFSQLADIIIKKFSAVVVFIGSADDSKSVDHVVNMMENKDMTLNTGGVFSLSHLKALISKMDLFLSVDTGPIYIAEALGVPTVDIVGPMDENEQPPVGPIHRIVKIPRKKAELHIMNARSYNRKEARRQVEGITVSMVEEEVCKILSKK